MVERIKEVKDNATFLILVNVNFFLIYYLYKYEGIYFPFFISSQAKRGRLSRSINENRSFQIPGCFSPSVFSWKPINLGYLTLCDFIPRKWHHDCIQKPVFGVVFFPLTNMMCHISFMIYVFDFWPSFNFYSSVNLDLEKRQGREPHYLEND